jgi:hypothetical protein
MIQKNILLCHAFQGTVEEIRVRNKQNDPQIRINTKLRNGHKLLNYSGIFLYVIIQIKMEQKHATERKLLPVPVLALPITVAAWSKA